MDSNDTSYSKEKNEVYITIHSDEEYVHRELADYFTFEVPEAKFLKRIPDTNTGMEPYVYTPLLQEICIMGC